MADFHCFNSTFIIRGRSRTREPRRRRRRRREEKRVYATPVSKSHASCSMLRECEKHDMYEASAAVLLLFPSIYSHSRRQTQPCSPPHSAYLSGCVKQPKSAWHAARVTKVNQPTIHSTIKPANQPPNKQTVDEMSNLKLSSSLTELTELISSQTKMVDCLLTAYRCSL